jgi:hypothetical protein
MRRVLPVFLLLLPLLAIAQKPIASDLAGELRAKDHGPTFQAGEVIALEASFTSSAPNKYLEPCELFSIRSFGYPRCRFFNSWSFSLESPGGTWAPIKEQYPMSRSGPMIEVPDHDLSTTPTRFTYEFTWRQHFDRPGKYTVRLTSQIALDDDSTPRRHFETSAAQQPAPHTVPFTLDYSFTIVPSTAEWRHDVILRGVEAIESSRRYRNQNDPGFIADGDAINGICNLRTADAAIALARVLADGHNGDCIATVDDRPAAASELRRLLSDPSVGVTQNFLRALAMLEDSKPQAFEGLRAVRISALDQLRIDLFQALSVKQSKARLTSLSTVLSATDISGAHLMDTVPQHFSDALTQAAADNFDALPDSVRTTLLRQDWPLIRSPLMLATVQREAEHGNDQAILDWKDLDPAGAASFIRAEIVRPVPRFYAYYLELSNATLPDLEEQLSENLTNIPPGNDIGPAATLVARYATVGSLPIVLPFYDQHASEWPCSTKEPLLAYLLRVSPKDAAPRLRFALHGNRCPASSLLSDLGALHPSPLLEELAFQQIEADLPFADDAAHYLQNYGSPSLKSRVWEELVRWKSVPHSEPTRPNVLSSLVSSFEAAQGWVLSLEESHRLHDLLGPESIKTLSCNYQCGDPISVAPGMSDVSIYRQQVDPHITPGLDRVYLWSTSGSHIYHVNQYTAPTLTAFLEKLGQFPIGVTFSANPSQWSDGDSGDWGELINFLATHGYHLRTP